MISDFFENSAGLYRAITDANERGACGDEKFEQRRAAVPDSMSRMKRAASHPSAVSTMRRSGGGSGTRSPEAAAAGDVPGHGSVFPCNRGAVAGPRAESADGRDRTALTGSAASEHDGKGFDASGIGSDGADAG